MHGRRSSRGHALDMTTLACMGALACGPGKTAQEDGETSIGFPLDTGIEESPDPQSETETETETEGDTLGQSCSHVGTICGELSVCQCSCDYSEDCCTCELAVCTLDSHCDEGQGCARILSGSKWAEFRCVPDYCESVLITIWIDDRNPSLVEELACAHTLELTGNAGPDLAPLAKLRYLDGLYVYETTTLANLDGLAALERVGQLLIFSNPELTSIESLAGLQELGSGEIINNPKLPTAEVEALLAQIPGGDGILVCGNLDGDPC